MMKKILIVLAVILAIAGIAVAVRLIFFGETPEAAVRRTFDGLADSIRKSGNEGMIAMLERAKTASRFFAEQCKFKLDRVPNGTGIMRRKDIASNALLLRRNFKDMRVRFYDMEIQIEPGGKEASVLFTAAFEGSPIAGRNVREAMEMEAVLTEQEGKWLFRSISVREIIRK